MAQALEALKGLIMQMLNTMGVCKALVIQAILGF